MRKSVVSQVVLVMVCGLAIASARVGLAAGTDQGNSSSANTTSPITGTDPEPIDPGVVNLVLALLGIA